MNETRKIAIIVPSLSPGGMERVAVLCANYLSQQSNLQVFLITLNSAPSFFSLHPEVVLVQPEFAAEKLGFFRRAIRTVGFLRSSFRKRGIQIGLSFGDRYNSLCVLAHLGTGIRMFVSNRQNPQLSNGRWVDLMNFCFYRFAAGILAQTNLARTIFLKRYGNRNVVAIPNPVVQHNQPVGKRAPWIVYVGRFGDQKNQADLVRLFDSIDSIDWQLYLVGDGPKRHLTESAIQAARSPSRITITGFEKDVSRYYYQGSIFAFTSRSEGFPNALAEAMSAGMAVIAYDCIAGPSDLIDDNVNGFLIPDGDEVQFRDKLSQLMTDEALRDRFGRQARCKAAEFSQEKIISRIAHFILS